jgi:glutamate dehydrogenase
VELGDGELALIRYTISIDAARDVPDVDALNARLDAMVRGWEPSVEEALGTSSARHARPGSR